MNRSVPSQANRCEVLPEPSYAGAAAVNRYSPEIPQGPSARPLDYPDPMQTRAMHNADNREVLEEAVARDRPLHHERVAFPGRGRNRPYLDTHLLDYDEAIMRPRRPFSRVVRPRVRTTALRPRAHIAA
ncbi:MAG: hypothetical protein AAF416_05565 [Pseudomonadota bacterium]